MSERKQEAGSGFDFDVWGPEGLRAPGPAEAAPEEEQEVKAERQYRLLSAQLVQRVLAACQDGSGRAPARRRVTLVAPSNSVGKQLARS